MIPPLEKGESLVGACVLTALYARGAPHGSRLARRRWCLVRDALCRHLPSLSFASQCLQEAGLWDEASVIADGRLVDWATCQIEAERVVTAVDSNYPSRWLDVLGSGAPPCFWIYGQWPKSESVSVVGSRHISSSDWSFAHDTGRETVRLGRALVTGGAVGSDSGAMSGAIEAGGSGRVVVLLPSGLEEAASHRALTDDVVWASVTEPWAPFSAPQAMERNTLIFAASPVSVVVHARFQEGGSWHGAVGALRDKLSVVCVRGEGDRAADVLLNLGAVRLEHPGDLGLLRGGHGHRLSLWAGEAPD